MVSLQDRIQDLHKQCQDFGSKPNKDITAEFEARSKLRDLSHACRVGFALPLCDSWTASSELVIFFCNCVAGVGSTPGTTKRN